MTSCGTLRSGGEIVKHFFAAPIISTILTFYDMYIVHSQLAAKNFNQLPNPKKYVKSLQDLAFHENQIQAGHHTICNSEEISSKIRDRRHLGRSNCAAHPLPLPPIGHRGSTSSATNFLYERKFAKIQAVYERIFRKKTSVIWVKILALTSIIAFLTMPSLRKGTTFEIV